MQTVSSDVLASHRRMRASLLAIRDLDPPGIMVRIAEMDAEIARLTALLDISQPERDVSRLEIVSIAALRAA